MSVHEHAKANWGRSCESLQTRFSDQSTRLAELEGMRSMVASISLMRTLRRANARECVWVEHADTTAISELAANGLQQGPCYSEYQAAIQAAHDLPEDEQINAANDAFVLLFSEDCSTGIVEAPELDTSDEEMEEEMDDTTDEVMDQLVQTSESSLIQQHQDSQPGPLSVGQIIIAYTVGGWQLALASLPWFIAAVLGALVFALLCNLLGHALVRIFRYIRCKMFGSSCSEYAPATWVRALIGVGCGVTGVAAGPLTGVLGVRGLSVLAR